MLQGMTFAIHGATRRNPLPDSTDPQYYAFSGCKDTGQCTFNSDREA
jgi:hypothetical protein